MARKKTRKDKNCAMQLIQIGMTEQPKAVTILEAFQRLLPDCLFDKHRQYCLFEHHILLGCFLELTAILAQVCKPLTANSQAFYHLEAPLVQEEPVALR